MHRTLRSARPAAALALASTLVAAATLVVPGAAFAGTTEPTPVTTTTTSTTTTGTSTGTSTATPSDTSTTTSSTSTDASTTSTTGSTTTAPTTTSGTSSSTSKPGRTGSSASSTTAAELGAVAGGDSARFGLRAAAALPATSTDPTLVGAGFLERELVAGDHHLSQTFDGVDYPDYGLTLDAVLALDAAGAGQSEATAATQYVADHLMDYISSTEFDPTGLYAGATAKTLVVALAQGVDPRAFGGVDLIASLQSRQQPSGRFTDQSAFGDNSNMFGQSLAVIGLSRAGQPVTDAVGFIRANQCADGGFSLFFTAPCASDPDATSFAVQALVAAAGTSDSDAQQGLDYLAGLQGADGGVGGAGPTATANANSTGLAGQAFLAGGRSAQSRAAVGFLTGLQYDCDAPLALRGAIAYNAATKAAATEPTDQDRRSTSQALLALAGTPLFAVSATGADATAPDLACAASSTSTTTTATSSTSGTTSSSADPSSSGSAGGDPATDPAAAVPDSLAFTGTDVAGMVLLALLLLAAGAGALVVSRRKGAHA